MCVRHQLMLDELRARLARGPLSRWALGHGLLRLSKSTLVREVKFSSKSLSILGWMILSEAAKLKLQTNVTAKC
jgi:hypothetical protein